MTIGILGGSFNPAHRGHRHISLEAMRRLGLDAVWWMVSPQNPLKSSDGMAPFAQRLASASREAGHPRIVPTDIEVRLNSRYTAETLALLQARFPRTRFVWMMGADNLQQIHRWQDWHSIFERWPVAVFDRPGYLLRSMAAPAAKRFRRQQISSRTAMKAIKGKTPVWFFGHIRLDSASATVIRAQGGNNRIAL